MQREEEVVEKVLFARVPDCFVLALTLEEWLVEDPHHHHQRMSRRYLALPIGVANSLSRA